MKEPIWILREVALLAHEQSLAQFGGSDGLRDEGLLDAVATSRDSGNGRIDEVAFTAPAGCLAARIALGSQAGQVRDDYELTLSEFRLD